MSGLSRRNLHWAALSCGLVCALGLSAGAIWLFSEAAAGNHSNGGNILRLGSGVALILILIFVVGMGAIYWKSSSSRTHLRSGM